MNSLHLRTSISLSFRNGLSSLARRFDHRLGQASDIESEQVMKLDLQVLRSPQVCRDNPHHFTVSRMSRESEMVDLTRMSAAQRQLLPFRCRVCAKRSILLALCKSPVTMICTGALEQGLRSYKMFRLQPRRSSREMTASPRFRLCIGQRRVSSHN